MNNRRSPMVFMTRALIRKYVRKYYPHEAARIMKGTDKLYRRALSVCPDLGGRENMLSDNMDMALLIFAAYEASGHRFGGKAIDEIMEYRSRLLAPLGAVINMNRRFTTAVGYRILRRYKKKLDYNRAIRRWGNTWGMEINPDHRRTGFCFYLTGCPIVEYAQKHGYMHLMPHLCASDQSLASLFHAKLIRTHTSALGSDSCDYWFVGDKDPVLRKYKDTPVV